MQRRASFCFEFPIKMIHTFLQALVRQMKRKPFSICWQRACSRSAWAWHSWHVGGMTSYCKANVYIFIIHILIYVLKEHKNNLYKNNYIYINIEYNHGLCIRIYVYILSSFRPGRRKTCNVGQHVREGVVEAGKRNVASAARPGVHSLQPSYKVFNHFHSLQPI